MIIAAVWAKTIKLGALLGFKWVKTQVPTGGVGDICCTIDVSLVKTVVFLCAKSVFHSIEHSDHALKNPKTRITH
jgi:hypothetical protein